MSFTDPRLPLRKRLTALLETAEHGRAAIKRCGAWLDDEGQEFKALLVQESLRKGVDLPPEAVDWPGKRLLRLARGLEASARIRRNPIRQDEEFQCLSCGLQVPMGGRTVRDHCPRCLRSLHVDRVPGDRSSDCGGLMVPEGATLEGRAGIIIHYRCQRCGFQHRNVALSDADLPDDPVALRRLVAGGGAPQPEGGEE